MKSLVAALAIDEVLQNEIDQLRLQETTQDVVRQIQQRERALAYLRQILEALQKNSDDGGSGL